MVDVPYSDGKELLPIPDDIRDALGEMEYLRKRVSEVGDMNTDLCYPGHSSVDLRMAASSNAAFMRNVSYRLERIANRVAGIYTDKKLFGYILTEREKKRNEQIWQSGEEAAKKFHSRNLDRDFRRLYKEEQMPPTVRISSEELAGSDLKFNPQEEPFHEFASDECKRFA